MQRSARRRRLGYCGHAPDPTGRLGQYGAHPARGAGRPYPAQRTRWQDHRCTGQPSSIARGAQHPACRHAACHLNEENAMEVGRHIWAIAEGYIPGSSADDSRELVSHETACLLNTGDKDANVRITLYFADREPVGPYKVTVPARRTLHLRFNDLNDPEPVPRD